LVRGILTSLQTTSVHGFDILVRGTIIEGIINVVVILSSIIVAIIAWKIAYDRTQKAKKSIDSLPPIVESVIWCLIFGFLAAFVFSIIGDSVMSIIVPEYVVINNIVEKAAGIATT
jgi:hypothetical protein